MCVLLSLHGVLLQKGIIRKASEILWNCGMNQAASIRAVYKIVYKTLTEFDMLEDSFISIIHIDAAGSKLIASIIKSVSPASFYCVEFIQTVLFLCNLRS